MAKQERTARQEGTAENGFDAIDPDTSAALFKKRPFCLVILPFHLLGIRDQQRATVDSNKDATVDMIEHQKDAVGEGAEQAKKRTGENAATDKANIGAEKETANAQLNADKAKAEVGAGAAKARLDSVKE